MSGIWTLQKVGGWVQSSQPACTDAPSVLRLVGLGNVRRPPKRPVLPSPRSSVALAATLSIHLRLSFAGLLIQAHQLHLQGADHGGDIAAMLHPAVDQIVELLLESLDTHHFLPAQKKNAGARRFAPAFLQADPRNSAISRVRDQLVAHEGRALVHDMLDEAVPGDLGDPVRCNQYGASEFIAP
jgi:hypothetical protein